jgi:fructosamine-3-kinase
VTLTGRIAAAITQATGRAARIIDSHGTTGGCISDSRIVKCEDGRNFFVKLGGPATPADMFGREFEALRLLRAAGATRVPEPIACASDYIIMEAFQSAPRRSDWQALIGRGLAELHRTTACDRFGFAHDNYIGASKQPNGWSDEWIQFWRERRLLWQLDLFAPRTDRADPLLRLGYRLAERLDERLAQEREPAVLLHGDLWSGNAGADERGAPIIFDPASYHGQREAEFGMMRLFGGFDAACERAYQEIWPFQAGADERITIYRLYHELNHLNLFGRAYYQTCLSTLRRCA